jgi:DNA primase
VKNQKVNLDFIDIQSILDELQIPYTTRGKNVSEGWIGTQCPFPGCNDRSNHCGLCLTSPVVSCFACGTKGNYLSFLAAYLKSWPKAIEIIQKFSPRELKVPFQKEQYTRAITVELPKEATKKPTKYQKAYIKSRKFKLKELEILYDFYYNGPIGKWANRIIVPIYYNNRLVTFSSIDIAENSNLRYKHLSKEESIIHTKELLYGMDSILNYDIVMVVEGFFDKARIGQNCVSTMGTLITPEQFKLLTRFKKVILVLDGDKAGYENSIKIANNLSVFTDVERIILPEGTDPDSLDDSDVKELKNMIKKGF